MTALVSPVSGRPLAADTPWSLSDGANERWPVIDGIPYLRARREDLVAKALDHLDRARAEDALILLLADQDDWWTGPAPEPKDLRQLVRERDTLTLRAAMALLNLGPVADYFAYRWSDPTYLAGLALLEAHWTEPRTTFELACGIGHYLRELSRRGVRCLGADVVFAKCWLAKHWVALLADYLVFDAALAWPIAGARFDLVMCHDAFYFLSEQPAVAERLRAAAQGGTLAISHVHNSGFEGGAKGPARSASEWASLFPDATVYDERALLNGLFEQRAPHASGWRDDPAIEAFSLIEGGAAARRLNGGIGAPPPDAKLRANPLLADGTAQWPSRRYRDEYAAGCAWADPASSIPPERSRKLVDLPERW